MQKKDVGVVMTIYKSPFEANKKVGEYRDELLVKPGRSQNETERR